MKKLFLLFWLAAPVFAAQDYNFQDPKLNAELANNYKEHEYPIWVNARGSSATVTYINVSSITINGVNYSSSSAATTVAASSVTGTTTNDNASAGRLGEYVESLKGETGAGTSATWIDATSISLTAGDWDVSALINILREDVATVCTEAWVGISITSGNSATGLVIGSSQMAIFPYSSTIQSSGSVPNYRMSLSGTTTVYLKHRQTYSGGNSGYYGRLSARRVR